MFEIKLINEVQKYPCIYNRQDAGYTNKLVRDRAWKAIAAALGAPIGQCKGRWRTLKDRFVKDFNKKSASESEFTPKKIRWKFSEPMSFFKDYVVPRPTSTSLHSKVNLEDILQNQSFDPPSLEEPTSPTPDFLNSENCTTFDFVNFAYSSRTSNPKAGYEERDKFLEIIGNLTKLAEKAVEKKGTEEEEDSAFCKFLISIVKKVDKTAQHRIKIDLLNKANKMVEDDLNKK